MTQTFTVSEDVGESASVLVNIKSIVIDVPGLQLSYMTKTYSDGQCTTIAYAPDSDPVITVTSYSGNITTNNNQFIVSGVPIPFTKYVTYLDVTDNSHTVNKWADLPQKYHAIYQFITPNPQIFYGTVNVTYERYDTLLGVQTGPTTINKSCDVVVRYDFDTNNRNISAAVKRGDFSASYN